MFTLFCITIVLCLISGWIGDIIPSFFEMVIGSFSIFSLINTKEDMPMQNTMISAMSAGVAMNGMSCLSDMKKNFIIISTDS